MLMDEALTVEVAIHSADRLGEGSVWLEDAQALFWVDIAGGLARRWDSQSGHVASTCFPGEVSAVVPCRQGGAVVALGHELFLLDGEVGAEQDAILHTLARAESDRPQNRFNDCRCDPQGRLWAGTMSKAREPGAAGLYRLQAGGELELVLGATTLSNGMAWSPDGQSMYFIDSVTQRIDVFDFDGSEGTISDRRCLAQIDPQDGMPDGMTVDAEGGVWVCLFGGGAVRRYGSGGNLEAHIPLPVPHPTCPAFGGHDLSTMFITTTRHRLSPKQLLDLPDAGSVLSLRPGVSGSPANLYERGGR
jgi:sugar lactone lactonase YvrE